MFHDDLMVIFLNSYEGVGHQWCSRSLSVTDARTVDSLFIFIRWCSYLEQLLPRDAEGNMLFRCSTWLYRLYPFLPMFFWSLIWLRGQMKRSNKVKSSFLDWGYLKHQSIWHNECYSDYQYNLAVNGQCQICLKSV